MPAKSANSGYEDRLLNELAEIDQKIADLQGERRTIERLILRARRENVEGKDVTRKNSLGRVLIERAVIESLTATGQPMRGRVLFERAKNVDYTLKDVTFRSHLRRMNQRGLIERVRGSTGVWVLAKSGTAPQPSPLGEEVTAEQVSARRRPGGH